MSWNISSTRTSSVRISKPVPGELLLAMLIMEAAFGLSGLVVAPIYYAYIKNELCGQCLI
jgi:hypothetical protein